MDVVQESQDVLPGVAPPTSRSGPRRVLVVDDALTIRAYLSRLLSDNGYAVSLAMNGLEGLERALTDEPDLIISDLNMPQMTGLAMIRALRNDREKGTTPVLMLSTESDEHDIAQAVEAGANFFLFKPPLPEMVLAMADLMSGRGRV